MFKTRDRAAGGALRARGRRLAALLAPLQLAIAVWVGLIALAGLAAETGVVMLLYLDIAYDEWRREGRMATFADLAGAVDDGAVKRSGRR